MISLKRLGASREDKAKELADAIVAQGGRAMPIKADSADASAITSAVAKTVERYKHIDVLVVNAGIFGFGMVDSMPLAQLDQMLDVNVRGAYLSIQAAAPHLREGGRVITIGSNVAVRAGSPGVSAYQMTKGAVAAMVKGVALDLGHRVSIASSRGPQSLRQVAAETGATAVEMHEPFRDADVVIVAIPTGRMELAPGFDAAFPLLPLRSLRCHRARISRIESEPSRRGRRRDTLAWAWLAFCTRRS